MATNDSNPSLFHYARWGKFKDVIDRASTHPHEADFKTVGGNTALHWLALTDAPMDAVEAVHRACPGSVDITNDWGDTPLDLAIQRNASQKMINSLRSPNEIDENYCSSSSEQNVGNENSTCKLDDQFPYSVKNARNGNGRCNLVRNLKSSEISAVEGCKSIQNRNTPCGIKEEHVQLLNNIGSERSIDRPSSDQWDVRYDELLSYIKDFGDACVPAKFAENIPLGTWVKNQRRCYNKFQNGYALCSITKERIQLLNNIGFEWNIHSSAWNVHYEELVSYVKKFGDARVPNRFADIPFLGSWVSCQRRNYKKFQNGNTSCSITKERIQLLNNIGFEWSMYSSAWNVRYEELVRYVKEIGNTFVPCRFAKNPFLGNWVVRQRGNYKKFLNGNTSCGITTYQIQQLNNIGF